MNKQKAIIYARVSSKEQEIGGFSIPAQLDILRKYCEDNNFEIIKTFTESMSAKETGLRPAYDEMIKYLRKNKKIAINLVYEKNDRLLRNEYDSADIINLARTTPHFIHSVREMLILHKNAHPTTFFIFSTFSANSSLYSRNLSLEVKKGMNKAADLGFYPSKVPVVYKRGDVIPKTKRRREIIINPEKAGYVVRAFELYSTGLYSINTIAKKLAADGFIINKNPVQKANIERMLKNPFYIGEFIYNGKKYYSAEYTPIISKELFYDVQKKLSDNSTPRKEEHEFLYSNMIKCSHCGCSLIAQKIKRKYIYYTCMGRKCNRKKGKYLKEEIIDKLVETFLKSITIPEENMEMILTQCRTVLNSQIEYDKQTTDNVKKQIDLYKKRLSKLYNDKLDEIVSEEFYIEKRNEFQEEIDKLSMQLINSSLETDIIMEKISLCLELCKNAYNKYLGYNTYKKRLLLKLLVLNFSYNGEKLDINLKSTAESMLLGANSKKWWALRDLNS